MKQFFEQLQLLYTFFRKPKVKNLYQGKSIKRLLDTRWTGYLQATKAVFENFSEIVSTLDEAKSAKTNLDGEDIATAIGLCNIMKQKKFVFLLAFMKTFLELFGPVDRSLQSRDISYGKAKPLIEILQSEISDFRSEENLGKFLKMADDLGFIFPTEVARPRRSRQRSALLEDFSVECTISERANEDDDIKATYFEIIDVANNELKERFFENNDILLALSNASNMDPNELKPLEKLGLALPSEHEMDVAKKYVDRKKKRGICQSKFKIK